MIKETGKPNRQIERTKSWIFDAIMLLMDEMPYKKITVSDICERAGVARPTFYRYYDEKDDVLVEYLVKTLNMELLNIEKSKEGDKQDNIVLMFDYNYMIKYQKNLKKILSITDIENRVTRETLDFPVSIMKHYRKNLTAQDYLICRYKLCYQITGTLRLFFDWFINDMPLPVENVVTMLNAMNIPKTIQYRNIPSIVVRLKEE